MFIDYIPCEPLEICFTTDTCVKVLSGVWISVCSPHPYPQRSGVKKVHLLSLAEMTPLLVSHFVYMHLLCETSWNKTTRRLWNVPLIHAHVFTKYMVNDAHNKNRYPWINNVTEFPNRLKTDVNWEHFNRMMFIMKRQLHVKLMFSFQK